MTYDIIIIGCGPAGIFSALELSKNTDFRILMLDRGPLIDKRKCPASRGMECIRCNPCFLLSGWGGSGAFSDGKLTLSNEIGGWLNEYVGDENLSKFLEYVDGIWLEFGAPKRLFGVDEDKVDEIRKKATLAGLRLIPDKLRHLGTENCAKIIERMRGSLQKKNVEIRTETEVNSLLVKNNEVIGVKVNKKQKILGKYIIAAPGRIGAEWLTTEAQLLGLKTLNNPVDIGVRVEVAATVLNELTDVLYEPKLVYFSKAFDDRVRTFCMNPMGEVITESYDGIVTVNGQSFADEKTENTNFAILVSTTFTEPFREPIAYGKYIARLANLLSGGIMIQRLGDLEAGRRSTEERISRNVVIPSQKSATPGDLSFVLPYRYLADVREMLKAMDQISPGIHAKSTLLYGVEVKFYSSRIELNNCFETKIHNLFAIGDGAGITRGVSQASVSGIVAAREIKSRKE